MPIQAFLTSLGLIFLTEIGDKTMLTTMCLSAQYRRPWLVLMSTMLALSVSTIIAILVAFILSAALPVEIIVYVSGFLFIGLGIHNLVKHNAEEVDSCDNPGTLMSMFTLVLFSELGDKSQLATLALATGSSYPIMIFFGAVIAFFIVNAIGAVTGNGIAGRVPIRTVKLAGGILFIVFGILIIAGIL